MFLNQYVPRFNGGELYVNYYCQDSSFGNIIFCCTPIMSVCEPEIEACYSNFADYGYNIFAFDFYGTCNSGGKPTDISKDTLIQDFQTIVRHIRSLNELPIFLFGDTGTGGLLAQFYAAKSNDISAFAQYGQATYRDLSFLTDAPNFVVSVVYKFINVLSFIAPNMKVTFSIPKYKGFNAEKEDELYSQMLNRNPDCFKISIKLMQALIWYLFDKESPIRTPLSLPTLVFNAKHDRYFSNEYVYAYFQKLRGKKKFIDIDDCHNSYLFHAEFIASEVDAWFRQIINQELLD